MTINEILPPNTDGQEKNQIDPSVIGHTAIAEGKVGTNEVLRDLELGGEHYSTSLPEGINPFTDDIQGPLSYQSLAPSKLDQIPDGHFEVSREVQDFEGPYKEERIIDVHDGKNGKVISQESFDGKWYLQDDAGELMSSLGFEISTEGTYITYVPTPQTLVTAAAEMGVEIQLIPDQGYIDGEDYLRAFADGKYPVSTGTESNYRHDSDDDHLTAIVMGGATLKTVLQDAAKRALESDRETIDKGAQAVDSYTATLRAITAWHSQLLGEAYGKESGRQTLQEYGQRLGIPTEVTEKVIAATQEKARSLGLKVKEID